MDDLNQYLSFSFNEQTRVLLASFAPPPESSGLALDAEALGSRIAELGYGALRRNTAALGVLADSCTAGRTVAALAVAEAVDAVIQVTVAPDKMAAFLDITPAQGGQAPDEAMIRRALTQQGVVAGIRDAVIALAVTNGRAEHLLVAEGRPAVHGEDGRVEATIPESRNRLPQVNEKGLADYRNLGEILTVHAGDAVMRRIPASPGVAGETVTGAVIPAQAGKEAMFSASLTGVAPDPADPNTLAAAIAGQPVRVRDGIIIEPTYTVDEVSMSTGNVLFDGAVTVKGDVHAGMTIKASGDIQVGGTVEAATLIAGGDIVIKGGAIGTRGRKDAQGNDIPSLIQCGGSFTATYVQQARIEAGDSIFVDDVAMQSELIAINQVVVGNKQRGHIIGGQVQATLMIKAKVIGSAAHIATRVDIGLDPRLRAQQQRLVHQRQQAEEQLAQIAKLLEMAQRLPERVPADTAVRARHTADSLDATIARLREEEVLLAEQLRLARSAKVVAEQAIFEGVEVHCGAHVARVEGDRPYGMQFSVGEAGLDTQQLAAHGSEAKTARA